MYIVVVSFFLFLACISLFHWLWEAIKKDHKKIKHYTVGSFHTATEFITNIENDISQHVNLQFVFY